MYIQYDSLKVVDAGDPKPRVLLGVTVTEYSCPTGTLLSFSVPVSSLLTVNSSVELIVTL